MWGDDAKPHVRRPRDGLRSGGANEKRALRFMRVARMRVDAPGTDTSGESARRGWIADVHGHRTGHGDVSSGCREAVITNVARFRAPADFLCQGEGIGNVHGHATERNGSRERGGVSSARQRIGTSE